MSANPSFERVILKVLNGVQAGAEVSLVPGEYTVGTGKDDDIQLIDVSIKAAHARIRIGATTIEVASGAGSIKLSTGGTLPSRSDFQEIEPLDVVELGMVRLVLGPPNANWTTLTEKPEAPPKGKGSQKKGGNVPLGWQQAAAPLRALGDNRAVPVALLLLAMIGAGIWFFSEQGGTSFSSRLTVEERQKKARTALDQFPFGRSVDLRIEADGTLYAKGFVENNFERRALLQALEREGIQVNFRLGVIESLKSEIGGLIRAEQLPVSFDLTPKGQLTLEGVILDGKAATQFVDRIREGVIGLAGVSSNIKTAETILDEIQKLGHLAEIDSYVLFRLDGKLIEASGIIPTSRIDGWEGFLQSYVRRFAKDIGLRSYVQLQSPDGTVTSGDIRPIIINGAKQSDGDIVLDMKRLAQGQYQTPEFFARAAGAPASAPAAAPAATASRGASADQPVSFQPGLGPLKRKPAFEAAPLARVGNALISRWKNGTATAAEVDDLNKVARARAELDMAGKEDDNGTPSKALAEKYVPLFAETAPAIAGACRSGSRLTPDNLPVALFWLDLLSVSKSMSLTTAFKPEEQAFILEAALDPSIVKDCLTRGKVRVPSPSVYLTETERNPTFVRFLTREFSAYPLDVSGASLTEDRYIQMLNGKKLAEGGAPDASSRLAIVGELGAAVQREEGFWAVIYNPPLNWVSQK